MEKYIVAVTALIENTKRKILLVKRGQHEVAFPGKWALPGGKLEKGETVIDALKIEVMEEVGLEIIGEARYLRNYSFVRPDGHHVAGFVFFVSACGEVKISKDFDAFAWVALDELQNYDHIPGIEKEFAFLERV